MENAYLLCHNIQVVSTRLIAFVIRAFFVFKGRLEGERIPVA